MPGFLRRGKIGGQSQAGDSANKPASCLTIAWMDRFTGAEGWSPNSREAGSIPTSATRQPSSPARKPARRCGDRVWVDPENPSNSCQSSQRIAPGCSPILAASTIKTSPGWNWRKGPVKLSGAGPASTSKTSGRGSTRPDRRRTTKTPAASSWRSSWPIPRMASFPGGSVFRRDVHAALSCFCQERFDIGIFSIIHREGLFFQRRQLPLIV